ncbi:MAG: hypothetical protein QXT53_08065 [Ignisphaera sp.]
MDFYYLSRYRFLLSASSIALFLLFYVAVALLNPGDVVRRELVDYDFWLLFILSFAAGFLDVWLYWRSLPIYSTYIISLAGLILLAVGRLGSAIYSLFISDFSIQPVGGSLIDLTSIYMSYATFCGAYLVFVATTWHIFKGPKIFKSSPTLSEVIECAASRLATTPNAILYLVAFLIGFLVSVYPETRYSLPIGWDTLEYIANSLDFAQSPQLITTYIWLGGYRNLPPLLTWVSGLFAMVSNPFIFYKLYPPTIFGFVTLTACAIAYRVSGSRLAGILTVLAVAFNPWILGQSQQWQRHMLGLSLLLLYLYLDQAGRGIGSKIAVLMLLSISYEPAAVIALMISILELLWSKNKRFVLPAIISLTMLLYYIGFPARPPASITPTGIYVAGSVRYWMWDILRYTITCLLLLAPYIVIYKIWRGIGKAAKASIAILLAIFLTPVILTIGVTDQHRWYLMLLTILTPYAVAAFTKISKRVAAIATLLLVLIGAAYPFTSQGYYFFRIWASASIPPAAGYPWSLTPAIENISEVKLVAKFVEANRSMPALAPSNLYPALHIFVRNPTNIIVLQRVSLFPAVNTMKNLGIKKAIAITSTNMSKELEVLRNANTTIASQIRLERLREDGINVYMVELENLTATIP